MSEEKKSAPAKTNEETPTPPRNETQTESSEPTPTNLALSVLEEDLQRLQIELQRLLQRKQEHDRERVEIDTAIVAQRGAIGYVEMVLQRVTE